MIEQISQQVTLHSDGGMLRVTRQVQWGRKTIRQEILLCREQLREIGQLAPVLLDESQEKTYVIVDTLNQQDLSFEIMTVTTHGKHIRIYRGSPEGVEDCRLTASDFQAVLDWYEGHYG